MSGTGPGESPFEGLPIFGDLARLFASQGPVNWDIARQIALWLATEGRPEANVEPVERMRLEQLARVADLHVSDAVGLPTQLTGRALSVVPVTRTEWTARTTTAYRPHLERLAETLARAPSPGDDQPEPAVQMLGDLGRMMGPVLLGLQAGFLVGHLAQRSLGQYDLPLPRPASDELMLVPANIDAFAKEWSLPDDDLRLWVCLNEVAHHAVLGRPHVRDRLNRLVEEYVTRFEIDPNALERVLGDVDPADPGALEKALRNPELLLGVLQTPAQQGVAAQIQTLLAVIEGYVDHVLDGLGHGLVGSYDRISEAFRRRRVESSDGTRFAERLFGLTLGTSQYERGDAFVRGVVERAGEDALARLWASERELPTPAELEAPGLWLARIDLPDEDRH